MIIDAFFEGETKRMTDKGLAGADREDLTSLHLLLVQSALHQ